MPDRPPPTDHDLRLALTAARTAAQLYADALTRAGLPLPGPPPPWLAR